MFVENTVEVVNTGAWVGIGMTLDAFCGKTCAVANGPDVFSGADALR